jgi:hypothetical protein
MLLVMIKGSKTSQPGALSQYLSEIVAGRHYICEILSVTGRHETRYLCFLSTNLRLIRGATSIPAMFATGVLITSVSNPEIAF